MRSEQANPRLDFIALSAAWARIAKLPKAPEVRFGAELGELGGVLGSGWPSPGPENGAGGGGIYAWRSPFMLAQKVGGIVLFC